MTGTPPEERLGQRGAARVLIAEDEQHLGMLLEQFLAARGHEVVRVRDGRDAIARLGEAPFAAALVDVQMPGADGLQVLAAARALADPPEVAVVTGNGTHDTGLQAMRLGAYHYLAKPYRMAEVEALVGRMVEKHALVREVAALRAQLAVARPADLDFVTEYAPLRAVIAAADRAAPAGSPMLVSGEPGTGKLLLASRVHQASGRGGRPAVLECRGAAEADVMQPLRGAGTLVLRHVDALPAGAQRSLAEQLAGGAGARVVATVDGDPALRVAGGALTARLADCLAGVSVALPPLRERPGDVRPLVEHVLRALGAPGRVQMTVSALDALDAEPWPGNVPELRAVVLAAAARATDGLIDVPHLLRGAQVAG